MEFATFAEARSILLWSSFAIAFVMGVVVNKTNFCTMGAVSDMVNIGDSGRMRAWLFAIAIAILGVVALNLAGLVNFPPLGYQIRRYRYALLLKILDGSRM